MATDGTGATDTRSPVIIMSEEFSGSGQNGAWEAGRMRPAAETDQSSCLPLLVVPGPTPRSSTSSQSCLSVPGVADINGYITPFRLVVGSRSREIRFTSSCFCANISERCSFAREEIIKRHKIGHHLHFADQNDIFYLYVACFRIFYFVLSCSI